MRFITFAAVSVAFIASVSAKIGFGSCSETVHTRNWDYYSGPFSYSYNTYINHEIIAIDKQFDQLLGMAEKFGFKLPLDVACGDLGTVPPFSQIAKAIFDDPTANDDDPAYPADGTNFRFLT